MDIKIIDDEICSVTMADKSGQKISKMMTLKTLVSVLSRKEESIESRFMPPGLFKMSETATKAVFFFYYDSRIVEVKFARSEIPPFKIRIPRSVWKFTFEKQQGRNILKNSKIWFLPDDCDFNEDTIMYPCPLNNFSYTYSPGVCWGSSENAVIGIFRNDLNPFKMDSMYRMYFGMPFNGDLGGRYYSESKIESIMRSHNWRIDSDIFNRNYGIYEYLRFLAENQNVHFEPKGMTVNGHCGTLKDIMNQEILG